jgi:predicted outer membrane lipoprotein
MCEAKKIERLGLPLAAPFAVLGCIAAEFHQARLFGVQFKMEPPESLGVLRVCERPLIVIFSALPDS